ncbi:MAG: hypothetical protein SGJ27_02810 [Candidatus Melainabacteria bacterium]|nr:hypothetical protein [Candidatus Melainabacteria bacterium]
MKTRLNTKHLYLTSLLITASSLAIGFNQPVNSAPTGSGSKPNAIAKSTGKMKLAQHGAPPEAGVQLLMGILHRIGSEPLVAYGKKNDSRLEEVGSKSAFLGNAVDPAFVIRPQQQHVLAKRERSAGRAQEQTQSEQLLAMLPKKQSELQRAADKEWGKGISPQDEGSLMGIANMGNAPPSGLATKQRADRRPEAQPNLKTSINKLYTITKFVEDITARGASPSGAAADSMSVADADAEAPAEESRVIRTGSRSMGNRISNAPRIDEFSAGKTQSYNSPGQSAFDARKAGIISIPGGSAPEFDDNKKDAESTSGTTYMKPENPGLYKSIKEYGSPSAPEPLAEKKAKPLIAAGYGGGSGVAVAYIPPQLVAGIPGLRLGVPEAAVDAYLKGKGTVHRQQVNGWKVSSLTSPSTGKTALQVYLRHGTVQAFRVFDPAFVPDGLGVNLHGKLTSMKKKFGQQQFILDEPSSDSAAPGARNYVYPVNQISFQLARSTPKDQPTVQSLLLFQFL